MSAYTRCFLLTFFSIVFLVAGCDTSIDPVRKHTYSIYGYLSTEAQQQFIRVKPLDVPLRADANRIVDATVTLENMSDGTTYTLQDSVISFVDQGDTLITHNFWTDADIKPETRYRLVVKRDEEVVTTATTTTPTNTPVSAVPTKGNCLTRFRVEFNDALHKPILLRGEFDYDGQHHRVPIDAEIRHSAGSSPFIEFVPERQLLDARIPAKERITRPFAPTLVPPRCLDLDSDTIQVDYVYASSNWHEFDVDPTSPGNFVQYVQNTQVENGQGFFGALSRGEVVVKVDTSDTLQIGASTKEFPPYPGKGLLDKGE